MSTKPKFSFSINKNAIPKAAPNLIKEKTPTQPQGQEIKGFSATGEMELVGTIKKDQLIIPCRPRYKKEEDVQKILQNPSTSTINKEDQDIINILEKESDAIPTLNTTAIPILARIDKLTDLPDVKQYQYEDVPIESFGMGMLLGMGYDPNKHKSSVYVKSKNFNTLGGIGATFSISKNENNDLDKKMKDRMKEIEKRKENDMSENFVWGLNVIPKKKKISNE